MSNSLKRKTDWQAETARKNRENAAKGVYPERKPKGKGGKSPSHNGLGGKAHAPLKSKGAAAKRNQPALDAAYAVVDARCKGRCEWCRESAATEHHHLHTRRSRPDLRHEPNAILGICGECHDYWQERGATFRQFVASENPFFAAIYNPALDVLKVGRVADIPVGARLGGEA